MEIKLEINEKGLILRIVCKFDEKNTDTKLVVSKRLPYLNLLVRITQTQLILQVLFSSTYRQTEKGARARARTHTHTHTHTHSHAYIDILMSNISVFTNLWTIA